MEEIGDKFLKLKPIGIYNEDGILVFTVVEQMFRNDDFFPSFDMVKSDSDTYECSSGLLISSQMMPDFMDGNLCVRGMVGETDINAVCCLSEEWGILKEGVEEYNTEVVKRYKAVYEGTEIELDRCTLMIKNIDRDRVLINSVKGSIYDYEILREYCIPGNGVSSDIVLHHLPDFLKQAEIRIETENKKG